MCQIHSEAWGLSVEAKGPGFEEPARGQQGCAERSKQPRGEEILLSSTSKGPGEVTVMLFWSHSEALHLSTSKHFMHITHQLGEVGCSWEEGSNNHPVLH